MSSTDGPLEPCEGTGWWATASGPAPRRSDPRPAGTASRARGSRCASASCARTACRHPEECSSRSSAWLGRSSVTDTRLRSSRPEKCREAAAESASGGRSGSASTALSRRWRPTRLPPPARCGRSAEGASTFCICMSRWRRASQSPCSSPTPHQWSAPSTPPVTARHTDGWLPCCVASRAGSRFASPFPNRRRSWPSSISAVPTSFSSTESTSAATEAPAGRGAGLTILFLGRHEPRKGLDVLLDALPLLPRCVTVRVAGNGPATARLRERHRGDERIRWLGRSPRPTRSANSTPRPSCARRRVMANRSGWFCLRPWPRAHRSSPATSPATDP